MQQQQWTQACRRGLALPVTSTVVVAWRQSLTCQLLHHRLRMVKELTGQLARRSRSSHTFLAKKVCEDRLRRYWLRQL